MQYHSALAPLIAAALWAQTAVAADAPSAAAEAAPSPAQSTLQEAGTRAMAVAQHGPVDVGLRDQAVMHLPRGYQFVPQPEAGRLMKAMGNGESDRLLGLVLPEGDSEAQWLAVASLEASGYVKDDEARDWNADELLQSLKDGTEANNEERRQMGISEFEVTGWAEKPQYDADSHRLVWSALARDKGSPADAVQTINYNTYALGRDGYISLNLITDSAHVAGDKPAAKILLGALEYKEGKRYGDFNPDTDHVAEYGLAALVAGVAAKKLGLLAAIGAFLVKFMKPLLVVGVAALAGLRKLYSRRSEA